jgi:carboxymethylenebutenolidase
MLKRIGVAFVLASLAVTSRALADGQMVSYPSGSETVQGYLAVPAGASASAKKPAIVVIHEWWGLNDWTKKKADEFAQKGYVALAPDLYRGKVATDGDTAHQLMRGMPDDRALRDMKAAAAYLRARPEVDTAKMGVVGWCMGGGLALNLALAEPTLAGGVIYYGHLVTEPATIASIKVPLLGNFGGQDQGIPPESVKEFEAAAKKAGKSVDFKIYPDAGHAFASSSDPKVYKPADAKDADARTDAFFAKTLKGK